MTCIEVDDPFRCPDKAALLAEILALLPEGRAWQNDPAVIGATPGSVAAQHGDYVVGGTVGVGSEIADESLTTMQSFWCAYAEVLEYLHQRACALIDEFYCASASEMVEEWGTDFGYPDDCEPWDSLCEKVAAIGGATCAYLSAMAARRGYAIDCAPCTPPQADCARADCAVLKECPPGVITVRVYTDQSPAYTDDWNPQLADRAVADCNTPCPAGDSALECLIERFKPAHVAAQYIYV